MPQTREREVADLRTRTNVKKKKIVIEKEERRESVMLQCVQSHAITLRLVSSTVGFPGDKWAFMAH